MSMIDSYDDLSLHEDPPSKTNSTKQQGQDKDTIKLYFRRWVILLTFSMIIILNVFNLCEYFDIEDTFLRFYQKKFPVPNFGKYDATYWLVLTNLLCYIVFVFPAMFLLEAKGIAFSCTVGIFLTISGSWIKCASVKFDWFPILVLGQIFCAIAQPFIQNPIVKLSSKWFGQHETATATSV